jgi:hypothetical protein
MRGGPRDTILADAEDLPLLQAQAWGVNSDGYAHNRHGQKLHRVVAGALSGEQVDHKNHHRADCRKANLRRCSQFQNQWNRISSQGAESQFKGVNRMHPDVDKWQARITINGTRIHLGTFDTQELAAAAYDEAALKLHGDYARLNLKKAA